MPIVELSSDTVRLLRSQLVISTTLSIVKELVDNSIDAKSGIINVSISANTVDRIGVYDNGEGIAVPDLDALGRHGHTSKLKNFEDLRTLGGSTLGFRGESLAAICALGKVTITTRTRNVDVATTFDVLPDGRGIQNRKNSAAPAGTSVTVNDIFGNLAVRRKIAIKEAQSTTTKIKQLLTAYALARPNLRFFLREAGSSRAIWSYSPPRRNIPKQASLVLLLGPTSASQCVTKKLRQNTTPHVSIGDVNTEVRESWFEIEISIPRPDADADKISKGCFIAVDSRPVSSSRGTFKKIIASYRKRIGQALARKGKTSLKDPFIALNIRCSPGSYDVNLEPLKDDVAFTNEEALLELCDTLFSEAYPPVKDANATPNGDGASSEVQSSEPRGGHGQPADVHRSSAVFAPSTGSLLGLTLPSVTANSSRTLDGNATQAHGPRPAFSIGVDPPHLASADRHDLLARPQCNDDTGPAHISSAGGSVHPELPPTPRPGRRPVRDSGQLEEEAVGSSMEAVNPWVIARMRPSRRQPMPASQPGVASGSRSPLLLAGASEVTSGAASQNLEEVASVGVTHIPRLDSPVFEVLEFPHPGQHPGQCNASQQAAGRATVPGGRYRNPLPRNGNKGAASSQLETPQRQSTRRQRSGLNTPSESSPQDQQDQSWRRGIQRGGRHNEPGLLQTRLSSWGPEISRQRKETGGVSEGLIAEAIADFEALEGSDLNAEPQVRLQQAKGQSLVAGFRRPERGLQARQLGGTAMATAICPAKDNHGTLPDARLSPARETNTASIQRSDDEDPRCYLMRGLLLQASQRRTGTLQVCTLLKAQLPLETTTNSTFGLVHRVDVNMQKLLSPRAEMLMLDNYLRTGGIEKGLNTIEDIDAAKLSMDTGVLLRRVLNLEVPIDICAALKIASASASAAASSSFSPSSSATSSP